MIEIVLFMKPGDRCILYACEPEPESGPAPATNYLVEQDGLKTIESTIEPPQSEVILTTR